MNLLNQMFVLRPEYIRVNIIATYILRLADQQVRILNRAFIAKIFQGHKPFGYIVLGSHYRFPYSFSYL